MMKLDFIFSRISKEEYFLFCLLGVYVFVSHFILCLSLTFLSLLGSFIFWIFIYNLSLRLFLFLFPCYTLLVALMLPLYTYDGINLGIVASIFETNLSESVEYISTLSYYHILAIFTYILFGFILLYKLAALHKYRSLNIRKVLFLFLFLLLITFYKPVKEYMKGGDFSFLNIRVYPIQIVSKIYHLTYSYLHQKALLEQGLNVKLDWKIHSVNPKYGNYVLVIGESMRADYISLYGYPIDTTPFLKKTNAIVLDNFISASSGTQVSLLRSFYIKDKDDNFQTNNNIATLANLAGFNTYWISNQGILGEFDTAASRLAYLFKHHKFTKKGDFDDVNIHDIKLLEHFKDYLVSSVNNPSPNLFVLHLMGSHPDFCNRLENSPKINLINKDISCYLETYKQTDFFISKIVDELKQYGSYSVIYFSDHGLSHYGKDDKSLTLKHNNKFKENYHVPFIQISSDDIAQKRIHAYRSGMDFLNGFAEWLGIEESSLRRPYSFFSEDNMNLPLKVFDWEKYIDFNLLPSDPVLLPENI
ncbi:phosphoethanolamine transferase [Pasteurella multocida]|uniref:phosphoethanolamine transferase n=1 Tax=Pasteurella multocida TaxID=747 RepID=UPI00099CA48B|nr:phosphoethanolamine transferase [Pasteurella multocida]MCL7766883.1 phosphoethanolamine transferase [Pasteurella multocida]MCL7824100.1 phosphoethanolamine transferase [Pasteurella multocida]MCL7828728.1 phosphoethanolamine transferase [Pasteurella multocida]MCL7832858.1 phosphoethanolamine transferase [Pasteurella multocida]OPC87006.1 division cell wall protein [Pasteurella multocida subsp. multocida]